MEMAGKGSHTKLRHFLSHQAAGISLSSTYQDKLLFPLPRRLIALQVLLTTRSYHKQDK